MGTHSTLGEFEHLVLLAVLRLGEDASAIEIRNEIGNGADRPVSRGALYKTLERLEEKGLLEWAVGDSAPERGGLPRRIFAVTAGGVEALRDNRAVLLHFWSGLEETLG